MACGVMLGVANAAAGADAAPQPLFADSAALEITLEGPFRTLGRERLDEPELPALLRYLQPNGRQIILDVQVKPRGISRLRNCGFPPLRLNFKQDTVAGTVFEGQDTLKLVTHCTRSSSSRDSVAREYQVYRFYNLLTERSFRVRWALIEYVDTESRRKPFTEPGFLIEEDWAVAARLGMQTLAVESLDIAELDQSETTLMALFQFMIGNTDWSVLRGPPGELCCHNGKVITPVGQTTGRMVLPYDFDQANFVDAEYAVHNESRGLRRNGHRYWGLCAMNEHVAAASARVAEVKQDWLSLVDAEPVSERGRRRGVGYIADGYEIIADSTRLERSIIGNCRP